MKLKKGDTVLVIAGNDKGKTGKILKVYPEKNRVVVEGVNIRKKHSRPSQLNPQGGIIEKEMPIDASNVMYYDTKTNKPSRIGYKFIIDEKTGKKNKVRVLKTNGEMI
ncbi:MAG TPA: 50S ribosomal protein L24 [Ignavibacteriales bacterium]|nr:50S ribosomal protein L24 [Ignavibacteriales bacterium]HOL80169.1 50S ribosomal protein L24 [Ignavibacteriales bacterium]HOM64451.1 50S ribosomal protein L24 [Ignavibacteriales bacterium]HPD67938.1 50S ribosomal protein L24 [Ignavibacteriales bacterium]HPP32358.1 50S ribosomal protein L24 [Ignavibacteriales bacterium]